MSEIGQKVRQLRQARGKSLRVVAQLAGMSEGHLSHIERGTRALDRRSTILKLAAALEVAPSEITNAALTTPRQPAEDTAITEVRLALLGISMGEARGTVRPVEQLRQRVNVVLAAQNNCDGPSVGAALPALIRDLHTSLDNTRRNERELLRLTTLAHVQCTQAWLAMIGAPLDLGWQAATLARQAAEDLGEPVSLGISAFGTSMGLLAAGAYDLAASAAKSVELPLASSIDLQVAGILAVSSSLVSAARSDRAERSSALAYAAELAERTGETNQLGLGFGPSNVAVWKMQTALEAGEFNEAATLARDVRPDALTVRARQAMYWREYGRALARLPKQQPAAVRALRQAERISPETVHRSPLARSVLAELLARAKQDAVGRELRGLAHRAGLPV